MKDRILKPLCSKQMHKELLCKEVLINKVLPLLPSSHVQLQQGLHDKQIKQLQKKCHIHSSKVKCEATVILGENTAQQKREQHFFHRVQFTFSSQSHCKGISFFIPPPLQQKGKSYSVLAVGLRIVFTDHCSYNKVRVGV